MKRPYIPFFAFLVLLLLTLLPTPFSFDFATSVVPGWHTTVFPPYFIWTIISVIILLLIIIGYWLLLKKVDKINWTLFAIHFLLTTATVIFLSFPTMFLNMQLNNQEELIKALSVRIKLIPAAWMLFITGQILFLIYFFRAINSKRTSTSR